MLEIKKLKESKFFVSNEVFVQTGRSVGAFGEVELDGYYEEKGSVLFNNIWYKDYSQYVISDDKKILGIYNFSDFPKELQQVINPKLYAENLENEKREYENYLKLKEKFEK